MVGTGATAIVAAARPAGVERGAAERRDEHRKSGRDTPRRWDKPALNRVSLKRGHKRADRPIPLRLGHHCHLHPGHRPLYRPTTLNPGALSTAKGRCTSPMG